MPGKPGQSELALYEPEIQRLFNEGATYRQIAGHLADDHNLKVTYNAVFSFITAKHRRHKFHRSFLAGLDPDLREELMRRLVAEWSHDSTALEGNTLTLGETLKVLQYGLTINGKPLKDHEEVMGHAKAIDIIESLVQARAVGTDDLFKLHQAVMPRVAMDALNPVGAWKQDYNGTTGVANDKTVYMEYAKPQDVPSLMKDWLVGFNSRLDVGTRREAVLDAYQWSHLSFVRIHPFFDGNGRLARLLANLPVLRGGFPPLMISATRRLEYIASLWDYQWAIGPLAKGAELLPEHRLREKARHFFAAQWQQSVKMLAETRKRQRHRAGRRENE